MSLRLTLLALLLPCISTLASARDHIVERAFLADAEASLSFAQAQALPFAPYRGVLSRGYTDAATWLRLRIAAPDGADRANGANGAHGAYGDVADGRLIVRVRPTFIDDVALFDPLAPGVAPNANPAPQRSGDRHPPAADAYPALGFNFAIPAGAPRDIYLRLQTSSTSLIHVEVLPVHEALIQERQHELAVGAYLALLGASLLWALLHWLGTREVLTGIFAFKQLASLYWGVMLLGVGRAHFGAGAPTGFIDVATSLAGLVVTPASLLFDYYLLRDYRPPRWGMRLLLGCMLFSVVELVLFAIGERTLALRLNVSISALSVPLVVVLLCLGRPIAADRERPAALPKAWPLSIYILTLLLVDSTLGAQLNLLDGLGPLADLLRTPELILYGLHAHSLSTSLLMVLLLYLRSRALDRHRAQVLTQLAVAEDGQRQERAHREDQERLLAMLAHELKTPLAVIRMRLGLLPAELAPVPAIKGAVREINEVIERCLEIGQMTDGRFACNRQAVDVAELIASQIVASGHAAHFCYRGPEQLVLASDPTLLRGIVGNLLGNAGKYSQAGSRIEIDLEPAEQAGLAGWRLTVSNLPGSAGWPAPTRLFAKYYRSEGAHRQTGSGLGLYLVQSMSASLGGTIAYAPTPTQIRFQLWLPA